MTQHLKFVWVAWCALCLAAIGVVGLPKILNAEENDSGRWVSKIISLQGEVMVRRHGQTHWQPVELNDIFYAGDQVHVESNSRAGIVLSNDAVMRLDQNTTLIFTEIERQKTFILRLIEGAANFFSHRPRSLKILTPFVNGVVEGTEFFVQVDGNQSRIDLFEGRILVENDHGILDLSKGEGAVAPAGKAPQRYLLVRPRESVQWAMYYPPILALGPGVASTDINQSLALFNDGQIAAAFARLASIDAENRDATFYVCRAALLLHVGRIAQAQSDIQQALVLDPQHGDALALSAVIAVVQNQAEEGADLARQAVQRAPQSASAYIALSYALQAQFQLSEALGAAKEAVAQVPDSGLAWARLADLQLSVGALDKGVSAAQKAVALAPRTAHAHTILGFAYLTRIKTEKAREAFNHAIELDSAAPLARLGLGLATIRDGDLKAGRSEIEIATGLDPGNSLVRSYLGKAYFDEKRDPQDGQQYAIAKTLDPNDPTPWFYDAIRKQSLNRPVEALQDLQKSIALNGNRAIYRSKLLLDSDEAARSASLARIYNDLGFQQRALVEGWQSVKTDPSNFSAHRFLADSYSVLPRHEIARVSELLQSQLLQPLNITPIQPRLTESNQFLISSSGPVGLSFNEFNPLFNRNRIAFQGGGLLGENNTYGAEGVVSGIYNKLSISTGYTHFETDGWRDNAYQDDEIANIFAQYSLSYKTNIQVEYRYRDNTRGDIQMRFFDDDFRPKIDQEDKTRTVRLGLRHSFSPNSDLIGNFSYQDRDFNQQDEPGPIFGPGGPIITLEEFNYDNDATSAELGYLFHSTYVNLVSGAGYFDINSELTTTTVTSFPIPPFPPPPFGPGGTSQPEITQSVLDVEHTNLYLYSYIKFPEYVTWTLGVSGDILDSASQEIPDKDQFNPKFGISWTPFSGTTLRGAAFKALKRTLITDQTIEPTQVAGFNQFFDDASGTESTRYGAAIDQQLFKTLFGGLEYSIRNLKVPLIRLGNTPDEVDWDEELVRCYLNWAPYNWLALTAEYLYEEFDRDQSLADGALYVDTHYVPIGMNFYLPSGLSLFLKGTYVNQRGKFEYLSNVGTFTDGQDDFWLFDAAIRYRLPQRYGFITLGASNLFDEKFQHFDTDRDNPRIQPERYIFAKVTLAFP